MIVRSHGTARPPGWPFQSKFGSTTTHFGINGALSRSSKVGVVARFHLVAEDCRIPLQLADMAAGIGVKQQLIRIEAVACLRLIGAMHAIAVDCARPDIGQIAVPDLIGVFRKLDACGLALALSSKRQSSTLVALAENSAKLTPLPSHDAPSGYGKPSLIWILSPGPFPLS